MPKTICFINYKGGVAKTTTTYHVGCALAQYHGKRVLLIDVDPQTNLTFLCASIEEWEKQKKRPGTIVDLYKRYRERKSLDTYRFVWQQPIRLPAGGRLTGLDLIPCDIDLLGEDVGSGHVTGAFPDIGAMRQQSKSFLRERSFLRHLIADIQGKYDYVLIDCPPNLYLMTQNALVASQCFVVTAIPDHLSTIGLNILVRKVRHIAELRKAAQTFAGIGKIDAVADLGGIVFTKVRLGGSMVTNVHSSTMAELRKDSNLGAMCFDDHTTELIGYSEAARLSCPVWSLSSDNAQRAANEYPRIADELLKRVSP
jgi:chromosome partitioning protein